MTAGYKLTSTPSPVTINQTIVIHTCTSMRLCIRDTMRIPYICSRIWQRLWALCRLQCLENLPSAIFTPIQTSFHVNCAFCSEQILHFHSNEENGNVAPTVLLTETTVRSTVAMPAVTHFLSSGYDQSTRSIILTRVCTAHWTHQDTHCHILMPFSLKCLFFSKTFLNI